MNVNRKMVGAALATTAAALFATSAVVSTVNADDDVKVKCYGANACKGKGFEQMSEKACIEKVGRG